MYSDNIQKNLNAYVCTYIHVYFLCIDSHTYRRYCSASNFLPSIKLIANYFFLFFSQLNFYSSCGVFISAMQCGQSHQHFMSHVIWLLQFTMSSLSLLYSIQLGKWSVDLVINHLSFRFHTVQLRMGEWDRMHNGRPYKYLFPQIKWLLNLKLFPWGSRIWNCVIRVFFSIVRRCFLGSKFSIYDKLGRAKQLSVFSHRHTAHCFVSLEEQQVRMLVCMNFCWCVTDWWAAAIC